ncbi:hypothetical protein [Paludisphaera rhizosphaerae]|uniref:hypothetical protein n=1 Tax=Paludisphaera rhizosphaerae TaxID=2711216 RepID=UPI0013EA55BF|nr:hypothetical protein [Paludisphaera rhizosphaerae]
MDANRTSTDDLTFSRFTDPVQGTFTMDVPGGWRTRGGLAHPQPGDRRPWVEAISPDGVAILADPDFPQSLCHFPGQWEGQVVPLAAGGMFLNLTPSADRAADWYVKNLVPKRLSGAKAVSRRPRPDVAALVANGIREQGMALPRSFRIEATEIRLAPPPGGPPKAASILATSAFNGEYTMGMWAFWNATVYLTVAPADRMALAEQTTLRMIGSYRNTPRMFAIAQRDEAIIAANGQAANAAQWNWFAGQQAAHQAQSAVGDMLVANYWTQQAANDGLYRSWERNQAVYDRLSQDRSDAMMDRQRLADDQLGRQYEVPASSNYYWRNERTGEVVGTDVQTPPDYSDAYTPLRRL